MCLLQIRSGGEEGKETKEGCSLSPEDHIVAPSKILKNYLNERKETNSGLLSTGYYSNSSSEA